MVKNKMVIVGISTVLIVVTSIAVISLSMKNKPKENKNVVIEDTESVNEALVDDVTFSDIKLIYDGGITNLTATMLNRTKEKKNFKVKIIFKDDDNKEVKTILQVVENLEPNRSKVLTTGISGNYSYIKNIQFEIEREKK